MPPRIFIQMGISTWTEITVHQQKLSLASAKSQPLPRPSAHWQLSLSALQLHGPAFPAGLSQNSEASQEGAGGPQGLGFCAPRWVAASWLSEALTPPWQPLRSQPPAVSRFESPELSLLRRVGMRLQEVGKEGQGWGRCLPTPTPTQCKGPGPDSPTPAPASLPKGSVYLLPTG